MRRLLTQPCAMNPIILEERFSFHSREFAMDSRDGLSMLRQWDGENVAGCFYN
jgi:hypothetical protein